MINKFNFNSLFSKAWLSAVTPANMISDFKTCGVYPFNSSAIVATVDFDTDYNNCASTSHTGSEGTETIDDNSVSTSYNQSENDSYQ